MKTAVRILAAIVGTIIVVVVGGGLLLRSAWHVEASLHVDAPPEAVLHYVADLHKWAGWSVWSPATDDSATFTFNDAPPGPGQEMRWAGERLGEGSLTLAEVSAERVRYAEKAGAFASGGTFTVAREAGGTKVTWVDAGDVGWNLPARFTVATVEKQLQPELAKSLGRLKALAEATQPGRPPEAAQGAR